MTNNLIPEINLDSISFFESRYGVKNIEQIIPDTTIIPAQFYQGKSRWQKYVENWDYRGLEKDTKIVPKLGIIKEVVIKKIEALLNSRHTIERDIRLAAAAFLMHISFENVTLKDPQYLKRLN